MSTVAAPSPKTAELAPAERFYLPQLDALRFFAFLAVFADHAIPHEASHFEALGAPHWVGSTIGAVAVAGSHGVDLFFALSAYLITTLLLREQEATGHLEIRNFYIRRILRIWPLYFEVILCAVLLGYFIPSERLPFHYIAGYLFLAANWVNALYGFPLAVTGPLWTVSIEEQFYLIWPLAIRRNSRRKIATIAVGVLITGMIYRCTLAWMGAPLLLSHHSTFSRMDPIALGCLLALARKLPHFSGWQRWAIALAALSAIIAANAALPLGLPQLMLGYPIFALGSTAILMVALDSQGAWLRNKALVYLGKISYGLYVWHAFGIFCAVHLMRASSGAMGLLRAALALAITVALAAASYRWLESPFLRLKDRFTRVPSREV